MQGTGTTIALFVVKEQLEKTTLDAYDDVEDYYQSPSRTKALAIYDKYDMGTASQLNISGEKARRGSQAMQEFRDTVEQLRENSEW